MQQMAPPRKFLEYVQSSQDMQETLRVVEGHFKAIKRELQRTSSYRSGLRMLDLGCGQGLFSCAWDSLGFQVTGLDLDGDLIDLARNNAQRMNADIRFEVSESNRLPFADASFDVVFANSLLEHVPDWEENVREWIRVLAPDGLLWIETTNVMHPRQREFRWLPLYSWWPNYFKSLAVKASVGPFPALANYTQWPAVHWFSFSQLRRSLHGHGLEVRDRFDVMDPSSAGYLKRVIRRMAVSSEFGRWLSYFLVAGIIILGRKPKQQEANAE